METIEKLFIISLTWILTKVNVVIVTIWIKLGNYNKKKGYKK